MNEQTNGWLVGVQRHFQHKKAIIMPQESSVLRQLWWDDHDEDKQLKQWKRN